MARKQKDNVMRLEEFGVPDSSFIEALVVMELIENTEVIPSARQILREEHFTDDVSRGLWRKVLELWDKREPIDFASLLQPLPTVHKTRLVGLLSNDQFSHSGQSIEKHCLTLADIHVRRSVYFSAIELLRKSSDPDAVTDIVADMESMTRAVRNETNIKGSAVSLKEAMMNYASQLEEEEKRAKEGRAIRVGTGFSQIDRCLVGGFNKGELIILAARPSVGKTALLLQIAENAARNGYPGLVYSLEMTNEQLAKRMLFSRNTLNSGDINRGHIDWQAFNDTVAMFDGVGITIDDAPYGATLDEIMSRATILHQQGRNEIMFIDYLQLIKGGDSRQSLNQIVGERMTSLKRLAKSLGIPIVLLSQLNRASAAEKRPPQLYDLRDSGSIEQDADTVLMLDRHEFGDGTRGIDVWVRKNRNGVAGDIMFTLEANRSFTRFSECGRPADSSPVIPEEHRFPQRDDGLPF